MRGMKRKKYAPLNGYYPLTWNVCTIYYAWTLTWNMIWHEVRCLHFGFCNETVSTLWNTNILYLTSLLYHLNERELCYTIFFSAYKAIRNERFYYFVNGIFEYDIQWMHMTFFTNNIKRTKLPFANELKKFVQKHISILQQKFFCSC